MNEEKFNFIYTAPTEAERKEVEEIKSKYEPNEKSETALDRLRRLNRLVTLPSKILSGVLGVAGILIFGFGLALSLEWHNYVWGGITGGLGLAVIVIIYPLHNWILKRNRKKYGQQIIDLSNEILNRSDEE